MHITNSEQHSNITLIAILVKSKNSSKSSNQYRPPTKSWETLSRRTNMMQIAGRLDYTLHMPNLMSLHAEILIKLPQISLLHHGVLKRQRANAIARRELDQAPHMARTDSQTSPDRHLRAGKMQLKTGPMSSMHGRTCTTRKRQPKRNNNSNSSSNHSLRLDLLLRPVRTQDFRLKSR